MLFKTTNTVESHFQSCIYLLQFWPMLCMKTKWKKKWFEKIVKNKYILNDKKKLLEQLN